MTPHVWGKHIWYTFEASGAHCVYEPRNADDPYADAINNRPPPTRAEAVQFIGGPLEVITLPFDAQLIVRKGHEHRGEGINRGVLYLTSRAIRGEAIVLIGKCRWHNDV
ncbi:MAG: hypothetical protein ING75_05610 [Rhodocyclaceae bacterium]|nr:hypothetical protein [Rhodocyclaceae bacterium]